MKKIISVLLCAATILSFASCKKSGEDAKFACTIKVTPTENSATVSVEVTDKATEYQLWVVESASYKEAVPEDAKTLKGNATEEFTSLKSDTEYIAAVYTASAGFKTKEFVTDKATKTYESLQGSDYVIIAMDETTRNSISSKISYYMPSDGAYGNPNTGTIFIDDWGDGPNFTQWGTASGPNSYGVVEDWLCISKTAAYGMNWFGYCYRLDAGLTDEEKAESAKRLAALNSLTSDYTFHFAMKSTDKGGYTVTVREGTGVVIGDENTLYGFKRDGEWHEIEIPMAVFMAGEKYNSSAVGNIVAFTQGTDVAAATLDVDAVFFYKKAK